MSEGGPGMDKAGIGQRSEAHALVDELSWEQLGAALAVGCAP